MRLSIVADELIWSTTRPKTLMFLLDMNHLAMERFRLSSLAMSVINELCHSQRGQGRRTEDFSC